MIKNEVSRIICKRKVDTVHKKIWILKREKPHLYHRQSPMSIWERALPQWGLKHHFTPKMRCIHKDSLPSIIKNMDPTNAYSWDPVIKQACNIPVSRWDGTTILSISIHWLIAGVCALGLVPSGIKEWFLKMERWSQCHLRQQSHWPRLGICPNFVNSA